MREKHGSPEFVVWENVPDALNSCEGRDFARVLDTLAELGAMDIAWRVLDAQFFGLAQRRERVLLVADFGGERAREVLFESEGVSRRAKKSRAPREAFAALPAPSADERGPLVANTLGALTGGFRTTDLDAVTYVVEPVAATVSASMDRQSTPRGDSGDNLIIAASVTAREEKGANSTGQLGEGGDPMYTLDTKSGHAVAYRERVRRLMPVECARLQGFPDDWNDWQSDSQRYKQFGNAIAVPVAEWIGRRMLPFLEEVE